MLHVNQPGTESISVTVQNTTGGAPATDCGYKMELTPGREQRPGGCLSPVHRASRGAVIGPSFRTGAVVENSDEPRSRGFSMFGWSRSLEAPRAEARYHGKPRKR